jgi:Predicted nucleotide-binding protein containing TIR-like domain
MAATDDLFKIADRLELQNKKLQEEKIDEPLQKLSDAANKVGKAWSGSWLGYHSRVYYDDLTDPPPGAHFSREWGMMETAFAPGTVGSWAEFRFDDIVSAIFKFCNDPSIKEQEKAASETREMLEDLQLEVISLLSSFLKTQTGDNFLTEILDRVGKLKTYTAKDYIDAKAPSGQFICRDMQAVNAGLQTPPHISVLARIAEIHYPFIVCEKLSKLTRRAASHMLNIEKNKEKSERIGTNVFIGHGRSPLWKDLKDFIQDRMRLPWDEFNRVPIAGFTNIARLSQMLDAAAVAFLIMTAEDEQADGKQHARQNVIHEAGLFQGRLGFERAILLLEDGCEEFSNVQGLGQIRFPKGNIAAIFEEIRKVLEREGLIDE